jgi:hypothetical protein
MVQIRLDSLTCHRHSSAWRIVLGRRFAAGLYSAQLHTDIVLVCPLTGA